MMMLCVAVVAAFWVTGHLSIDDEPDTASNRPVRIKLQSKAPEVPKTTLFGSVRDTMGFLLPGAHVASGNVDGRTNFEGQFWIDVDRTPAAELRIGSQGFRYQYVRALPLAREALFVALEPFAPWDPAPRVPEPLGDDLTGEGFARDEQGKALENAFIVVVETGATTRTNEAGQFRVPLPTQGVATLMLHKPAGTSGTGLAARAEPFEVPGRSGKLPVTDIIGLPAAMIRGTVRDADGRPLAGVPLQVICEGVARTIASGDGGAFRLGGLLPGQCRVRAFAFRGALGTERAFELSSLVNDCELHLRSADRRRLRVVTSSGKPVARAIVATSIDGLRRGLSRADDDGWVDLRAASEDAHYEVRTADDYRELEVVAAPDSEDQLVVNEP